MVHKCARKADARPYQRFTELNMQIALKIINTNQMTEREGSDALKIKKSTLNKR